MAEGDAQNGVIRFPRVLALDGVMLEAACAVTDHAVADINAIRKQFDDVMHALHMRVMPSVAQQLFPETSKGIPPRMPWACVRILSLSDVKDGLLMQLSADGETHALYQSVLPFDAWKENKPAFDKAVHVMENEFAPHRGITITTGARPYL